MGRVDDILDLIDAGLGYTGSSVAGPIQTGRCARGGCQHTPVDGGDFCGECRAWLRGDTDDDPYALPETSAPNSEPVDDVTAWVEMFGGSLG